MIKISERIKKYDDRLTFFVQQNEFIGVLKIKLCKV